MEYMSVSLLGSGKLRVHPSERVIKLRKMCLNSPKSPEEFKLNDLDSAG